MHGILLVLGFRRHGGRAGTGRWSPQRWWPSLSPISRAAVGHHCGAPLVRRWPRYRGIRAMLVVVAVPLWRRSADVAVVVRAAGAGAGDRCGVVVVARRAGPRPAALAVRFRNPDNRRERLELSLREDARHLAEELLTVIAVTMVGQPSPRCCGRRSGTRCSARRYWRRSGGWAGLMSPATPCARPA